MIRRVSGAIERDRFASLRCGKANARVRELELDYGERAAQTSDKDCGISSGWI